MDSREASKHSRIVSQFRDELGEKFSVEVLPVDFRVTGEKGDWFVERKQIGDFLQSWCSGRIFSQLEALSAAKEAGCSPLLLIEGTINDYFRSKYFRSRMGGTYKGPGVSKESILGMLCSVIADWKIPMVTVSSIGHSYSFLISLHRKVEGTPKKPLPVNIKKRALTKDEKSRRILESFDGISATLSKRILEKYKSVQKAFEHMSEWGDIEGMIGKTVESALDTINYEYGTEKKERRTVDKP